MQKIDQVVFEREVITDYNCRIDRNETNIEFVNRVTNEINKILNQMADSWYVVNIQYDFNSNIAVAILATN